MKRAFRSAVMAVAVIGCFGAAAWGQDPAGQDSPNHDPSNQDSSLGDVARKTRSQKPNQATSSKAQDLVDEMQQEQEEGENAPPGFKDYDAGDYRLFVPFPYELEGRDESGAVLLGSRLGVANTEVMAGNPIPIPANLSANDLHNLVNQLGKRHAQYSGCAPTKIGERRAFNCSLGNGRLLGHTIWGTITYVLGSNRLIPVMCVSPDEMTEHLVYGNPRSTYQQKQAACAQQSQRFRDERTTAQVCDQIIYPSIRLKEDIVVHPATISESKAAKPEAQTADNSGPGSASSPSPGGAESSNADTQSPALADLARQARQVPKPKAQAVLDNAEGTGPAPAGFQAYTFKFCKGPGSLCREASVVIPEKAEILSQVNSQNIFRSTVEGKVLLLYAGPADLPAPYRSMTDHDFMRIRDLANANGWSREKADDVSRQQVTVAGKPALITRFRFIRERNNWWVGERVLIEDRGEQFLLGCAAPEEHFPDAEAVCTTLVNSLQLP